ncbi:MAG: carboxypeptidase regulatory-like domain-containing protein [Vicinamibacterales bacterium]
MRSIVKCSIACLFAVLVLAPSMAYAQASIAGTVKDTSGAVLPGVTVEAASPVLIEKVRTVVTDGNGRYQMIDLRPGAYSVTFTLGGFNTVKREGVTLAGAAISTIDAEMRVGALEETVTVTGEAPVVDTSTITRQAVMNSETVDSLPTARNYFGLARMVPGTSGGGNDVGGSAIQDVGTGVTVHGSRSTDQRVTVNGVSTMTLQAGGSIGGQTPDVGSAAEVTVDTTNLSADLPTGGLRINFIPRDGGNKFASSTFFTISDDSLQGDNFSDELKAAGLPTPNAVIRNWDVNEALGGPIKRDKVWFWFSTRYNSVKNQAAIFNNLNAFKPTEFLYVPDTTSPGVMKGYQANNSVRVTYQVSPRNKVAVTYKADRWCNCPDNISGTVSPEAGRDRRFPRLRQEHFEWTSPITSKFLVEAVGLHLFERWGNMNLRLEDGGGSLTDPAQAAVLSQMIPVVEQSNNLNYRQQNGTYNNTLVPSWTYRVATSYVTGTHAFKAGINNLTGYLDNGQYRLTDLSYAFNGGVPTQLTQWATGYTVKSQMRSDWGIFAQDRMNLGRATVQGAIRFDGFNTGFPEQTAGPTQYAPNRNITFPESDSTSWKDLSYRTGFIYDLRGNGKTALKVSANKYLYGQTLNGIVIAKNPINTLATSTNRSWTDANRNFTPDCDLLNSAANGECGAWANSAFGTAAATAQFDPDLLGGWGNRASNWEFSASVQHELMRGVGVDFGYFRRIWQNFTVTDNLAVTAADYTQFSLNVPTDSRLPDGGGYTLTKLYALNQSGVGKVQNYNTVSDKYGKQIDHWNGFDLTVNARLQNGLLLNGGMSTGKQVTDNCEIVAKLPEMQFVSAASTAQPIEAAGTQIPGDFCHNETGWAPQFKMYGIYTVPKIAVQLSGTYRNVAGDYQVAVLTATNAFLATNSTLGRTLAGSTTTPISLTSQNNASRGGVNDILGPNYLDRRNELDVRIGKVMRFGAARTQISLDIFNALNSDAVVRASSAYATYNTPQAILNARLMKVSFNVDF